MTSRLASDNWTEADDTKHPVNVFSILGFKLPSPFPSLATLSAQQITSQSNSGTITTTGPTGAVNGAAPTNSSQTAWFTALLKAIGAPPTTANLNSLAAWYKRENGSWPPAASNNPLNSTLSMPGASTFNSVGVRNYASAQQGVTATAQTLNGYPAIVTALKAGNGLCGATSGLAAAFHLWSGGGYSSVC